MQAIKTILINSILIFLTACFWFPVTNLQGNQNNLQPSEEAGWFKVVSKLYPQFVLDVSDQLGCLGDLVHWNYNDPSGNTITQFWRWENEMLISKPKGLAMDLNQSDLNGNRYILYYPSNSLNQRFTITATDKYKNYVAVIDPTRVFAAGQKYKQEALLKVLKGPDDYQLLVTKNRTGSK